MTITIKNNMMIGGTDFIVIEGPPPDMDIEGNYTQISGSFLKQKTGIVIPEDLLAKFFEVLREKGGTDGNAAVVSAAQDSGVGAYLAKNGVDISSFVLEFFDKARDWEWFNRMFN